jgi:hypothetical protein
MKRSSDIESDSEDIFSSSSDEDEEGDNLNKYLNSLCVMGLSLKDYFCAWLAAPAAREARRMPRT